MKRQPKIPRTEMNNIRDRKIRDLNKLGYTMGDIAEMLSVSKTTVFNALKEKVDTPSAAAEESNLENK